MPPLSIYLFQDLLHIVGEDGHINTITPPQVPKYEPAETGNQMFMVAKGWTNIKKRMLSSSEWMKQCASYPYGYMTHLCITNPEFINKCAWKRPPRIMYLDIEVASDGSGMFPRADRNAIAMIGLKMQGDNGVTIIDSFDPSSTGKEDILIIPEFMKAIEEKDPDIIVQYNGWRFDLPYIKRRSEICGVKQDKLYWRNGLKLENGLSMRDDHIPKLVSFATSEKARSNLVGRLSYDIYAVDVLRDQKLMGLENKKMKTLAKHFLTDKDSDAIVELESGIKNIMAMMKSSAGRAELKVYLTSDVTITEKLSDIYLNNNIEFAEKLGVPIEMILSRSSGTVANLYMLRKMIESDIVAVDRNIDRYKNIYDLSRDNGFKKDFQGAYVDILRTGRIKNLKKYDFKGLYPNIIRTFNLSYETVDFDQDNDLIPHRDKYIINRDKDELILGIPDLVLNRTVVVHIDQSMRGMVPKMLDGLIEQRDQVKKELSKLGKEDTSSKKKLDSQQWLLKVISNSCYGLLSNRYTIGYLPIGITITGMGRWLVKRAMEYIIEKSGPDCIVEVDTDGIITTSDMPVKELNAFINKLVMDEFGLEESTLELEEEEFEAGYFYKMKNYIIKIKDGEIVKHGAYFKSSKFPRVYERAVNLITDYAIKSSITAETCKSRAIDFEGLTIDDFMLSMRMSKDVKDYSTAGGRVQATSEDDNFDVHSSASYDDRSTSTSSSLVVSLVNKYEKMFNFTPSTGDTLEYIVVKSSLTGKKEYEPLNAHDSSQLSRIDYEYYAEMIERMLGGLISNKKEALGLVDIWDTSISGQT